MGDNITIAVISSLISLLIGIFIGEPLKHFLKRLFSKKDSVKIHKIIYSKLKKIMLDLLFEMKQDLVSSPLNREFIIMSRNHIYNGNTVVYYFEDHIDLKAKLDILENYELVRDITYNNTDRYKMSEDFVEILNKYVICK